MLLGVSWEGGMLGGGGGVGVGGAVISSDVDVDVDSLMIRSELVVVDLSIM